MKTILINELLWDTRNLRRNNSNYHDFDNVRKLAKKSNKRLPTIKEWEQLINLGHTFDKKKKGIWLGHDHQLKSKSTRSIFLPTAGYRGVSASLYGVGSGGYYWSSTVGSTNSYGLYFSSGNVTPAYSYYRGYGFSVRCVQNTPF